MMSEELIREIVAEVIRQTGQPPGWWQYVAILCITFLSSALGFYASSYFRKTGEIAALGAKMDETMTQLKITTEVTEAARTAIQHADWHAREWKTLRRVKLEELLSSVYQVRSELPGYYRMLLESEMLPPNQPPIWKLMALPGLYFPELLAESQAVVERTQRVVDRALRKRADHIAQLLLTCQDPEWREKERAISSTLIHPLDEAIKEIETKAARLMASFYENTNG